MPPPPPLKTVLKEYIDAIPLPEEKGPSRRELGDRIARLENLLVHVGVCPACGGEIEHDLDEPFASCTTCHQSFGEWTGAPPLIQTLRRVWRMNTEPPRFNEYDLRTRGCLSFRFTRGMIAEVTRRDGASLERGMSERHVIQDIRVDGWLLTERLVWEPSNILNKPSTWGGWRREQMALNPSVFKILLSTENYFDTVAETKLPLSHLANPGEQAIFTFAANQTNRHGKSLGGCYTIIEGNPHQCDLRIQELRGKAWSMRYRTEAEAGVERHNLTYLAPHEVAG